MPLAHRLSKEGGSKIQLQLALHDGSTSNLHFTGEDAKSERAQVSKLLVQLVPHVTSQASAELEAKTALLQSDQCLHQLYRDLVITGVISADEFWANRLVSWEHDLYAALVYLFYIFSSAKW